VYFHRLLIARRAFDSLDQEFIGPRVVLFTSQKQLRHLGLTQFSGMKDMIDKARRKK
jgi:hypothetical protein